MDYQLYLQTYDWHIKRSAALKRAGYRCQVCNSPDNLNAHHRTYERLGNEQEGDITILCTDCHALYSRRLPELPYAGLRMIGIEVQDGAHD